VAMNATLVWLCVAALGALLVALLEKPLASPPRLRRSHPAS
jgi:hypothetical protein